MLTTRDHKILVPGHLLLDLKTSKREQQACAGAAFMGIGMGERSQWERIWPLTHGARPIPEVLSGWGVSLSDPN